MVFFHGKLLLFGRPERKAVEEGFFQPLIVLPLGLKAGEDDKIKASGKGFPILPDNFLNLAFHPITVVGFAELFRQADSKAS